MAGFKDTLKDALRQVAFRTSVDKLKKKGVQNVNVLGIDRIAGLVRHLGVNAVRHCDDGGREMITLYFNTYIRVALEQKRSRAFYQFVHQYRRFAEEILETDPKHAVRIAGFLDYYGHQAVRMGMGFLINVVAYDLAEITDLAFRNQSQEREALLDIMIDLDRDDAELIDMPGVIKAQILSLIHISEPTRPY